MERDHHDGRLPPRRIPLGDDPEHAFGAARLLSSQPSRGDPGRTHIVVFGGTWPMLAAPVWAAWSVLRS